MALWMKNKTVGIIAAAALLTAIVFIIVQLQPKRYPFRLKCESCGFTYEVKVKAGQTYPVGCPKCKARACWRVENITCPKCGYKAEVMVKDEAEELRCPRCNSGAYFSK